MMYVNDMPLRMSLVRKEDMSKYHISTDEPGFMGTVRPQLAGPYAGVKIDIMQSKLCSFITLVVIPLPVSMKIHRSKLAALYSCTH